MCIIDNGSFREIGHGAPGSPACPQCYNNMKTVYSKVKGKNQLRKIKGLFVCLDEIHDHLTTSGGISYTSAGVLSLAMSKMH